MDSRGVYIDNPPMLDVPDGIDPKSIGKRIILIREAMGMKAADFARHVGFTSQNLANYETGFRRPELDKALLLVKRTGATLDFIYLGDASGLPMRLTSKMARTEAERKVG